MVFKKVSLVGWHWFSLVLFDFLGPSVFPKVTMAKTLVIGHRADFLGCFCLTDARERTMTLALLLDFGASENRSQVVSLSLQNPS